MILAHVAIFGYALVATLAYFAAWMRERAQRARLQAQYDVLCDADAIVEAELVRILTAQEN